LAPNIADGVEMARLVTQMRPAQAMPAIIIRVDREDIGDTLAAGTVKRSPTDEGAACSSFTQPGVILRSCCGLRPPTAQ
jgi:hypothetical protein